MLKFLFGRNLGIVRHLGFDTEVDFNHYRFCWSVPTTSSWVIDDSTDFSAFFHGEGNFVATYSQSLGSDLYQIWQGHHIGQSSAVPKYVLDFRYVASFRNQCLERLNGDWVKNRGQISHLFTSCKNWGRDGRNVPVNFSCKVDTDILTAGLCSVIWEIRVWRENKFNSSVEGLRHVSAGLTI